MGFKRRVVVVRGKRKSERHVFICRMYGRYELLDENKRLPIGARVVPRRQLEPGTRVAMGDKTLVVSSQREPTIESLALDAVRAHGSIRKAAKALRMPFSTLREWVKYGRGPRSHEPEDSDDGE